MKIFLVVTAWRSGPDKGALLPWITYNSQSLLFIATVERFRELGGIELKLKVSIRNFDWGLPKELDGKLRFIFGHGEGSRRKITFFQTL